MPNPWVVRRRLVEVMLGSLANIGFFKQVGPEEMGIFLSDILGRARLSRREARRVEKIFRKISDEERSGWQERFAGVRT